MREMLAQSLGWEDLLEEEMATHSSILAWRIPWTEEPGGLQAMGSEQPACTHTPSCYWQCGQGLDYPVAEVWVRSKMSWGEIWADFINEPEMGKGEVNEGCFPRFWLGERLVPWLEMGLLADWLWGKSYTFTSKVIKCNFFVRCLSWKEEARSRNEEIRRCVTRPCEVWLTGIRKGDFSPWKFRDRAKNRHSWMAS